ncbi:hypothetical protein [Desulfobacter sp.]|uniref:hypothetical protein n=1 Tax=Desulfobacter sp. TaxID=2294 RepID=UPI003D1495BB
MTHQDLAQEFRDKEPGRYRGGVVVIFNNHVAGWMSELRDPQSWEPGCFAIDEEGNEWVAVGGNPYDGAKRWEPVSQK